MRAAIYTRVSTEEQTVEMQITAGKRYCEGEGWDYDIFTDKISGATTSRPGFDEMMSGVRERPKPRYQAIIIWKLDRLGRSTIHLLQLLEEFRNKDIQIVITTGHIDTSKPEGRLFFTIIAGFAELEREYIKQRIQASMDTKKAKGIPLGRKKGSKDKKPRSKMGYIARYEKTRRKGQTWYQKIREEEKKKLQSEQELLSLRMAELEAKEAQDALHQAQLAAKREARQVSQETDLAIK